MNAKGKILIFSFFLDFLIPETNENLFHDAELHEEYLSMSYVNSLESFLEFGKMIFLLSTPLRIINIWLIEFKA